MDPAVMSALSSLISSSNGQLGALLNGIGSTSQPGPDGGVASDGSTAAPMAAGAGTNAIHVIGQLLSSAMQEDDDADDKPNLELLRLRRQVVQLQREMAQTRAVVTHLAGGVEMFMRRQPDVPPATAPRRSRRSRRKITPKQEKEHASAER